MAPLKRRKGLAEIDRQGLRGAGALRQQGHPASQGGLGAVDQASCSGAVAGGSCADPRGPDVLESLITLVAGSLIHARMIRVETRATASWRPCTVSLASDRWPLVYATPRTGSMRVT